MTSITRLAARWPIRVITVWLATVAALAVVGVGIEDHLEPTRLVLPHTGTAAWDHQRRGTFGDESIVILEGPPAALDRQGPGIARRVEAATGAPLVSAWSGTGVVSRRLRPAPGRGLIVLDISGGAAVVPPERLTALDHAVQRAVRAPLRATVTGAAPLGRAISDAALEAAGTAEKRALPVLLIVLLLVFRSPIAALIPLVIAGTTVAAGRGVLVLLAPLLHLDATAAVLLSMIGLALGVDYSLLIVTRFREALADGDEPRHAAMLSAHTAGRTAAFAGATLMVILAVTLVLAPGRILVSAAAGAIVGTVLGVAGALLVTPALLVLLGRRVGPLGASGEGVIGRVVGAALARPRRAAALAAAPLLALALGITALRVVPPDPHGLPSGTPGAHAFAASSQAGFGPGLEVVISRRSGPVTDTRTLRLEAALERRLGRLPSVRSVAGPAPLGEAFATTTHAQLADARRNLRHARHGLARLRAGLGRAGAGADRLSASGGTAGDGAVQLADGAGAARSGADRLAAGTRQAADGTQRLVAGLGRAGDGADALGRGVDALQTGGDATAAGARQLRTVLGTRLMPGLRTLAGGLRTGAAQLGALREPATVAQDNAQTAFAELRQMSVGLVDPHYRQALQSLGTALAALTGRDPRDGSAVRAGYPGLAAALATASGAVAQGASGAQRLAAGGRRVSLGAARLQTATGSVAAGIHRLRTGVNQLGPGLGQLRAGASAAQGGLGTLAGGGGQLEAGLKTLQARTDQLAAGLRTLAAGQAQLAQGLHGAQRRLGDPLAGQSVDTPALFGSGFATLAALDTAPALQRAAGRYVLDLDRGGGVARIIVLTDLTTTDPRAPGVIRRAAALTADFARRAHVRAEVGGLASTLVQFNDGTKRRLPFIIIGIALATFAVLVPVLRSLLLPAIVVALNLLTVATTFGVLCLLFVGDHPVMGNTGALDVISVCCSFAIIFALSIDYQVFLLARMREGFVLTQDPVAAIRFGVEHTARIVTGAALIMLGTFAAFATTDMANVQQFGVGLAVSILVDATLVRLVLLPALLKLAGLRAWYLPDWTERRLPELDVEGVGYVRIRSELATRAADLW